MWVYNLLIATLQWRRSHRLCPPKADTPSFKLSLSKFNHALTRMAQRGFNDDQIALVLKYGRVIYAKGIVFFVVGRKEVAFFAKQGVDLRAVEAIQLLTKPNGVLITVYRNHDLKKIKKTKY